MDNLVGIALLLIIVCGLYYFWYKCQMFAVSKVALIMGLVFWPAGVITGIYWAIKDIFLFRNFPQHPNSSGSDPVNMNIKSVESVEPTINYWSESEKFRDMNFNRYPSSAIHDDDKNIDKSKKTVSSVKEETAFESLTLDQAYVQALDEYESKNFDRALYARLLAESDGKEELVKSRYIKLRAENLLKSNGPPC